MPEMAWAQFPTLSVLLAQLFQPVTRQLPLYVALNKVIVETCMLRSLSFSKSQGHGCKWVGETKGWGRRETGIY